METKGIMPNTRWGCKKMNKVTLTGRIASDIDLKTTASGVNNCSFRVASQRRFKNAEGNYDTDFITCVAWRNNADFICKYFQKGDPIEIVGSIQTRNYEKDGQRVYVTEVVVEETGFALGNKKSEGQSNVADVADDNPFENFPGGFIPAPADEDSPF